MAMIDIMASSTTRNEEMKMEMYKKEAAKVRLSLKEWLDVLGYKQMVKDIELAHPNEFPRYAKVINNSVDSKSVFKSKLVKGLTYFELI